MEGRTERWVGSGDNEQWGDYGSGDKWWSKYWKKLESPPLHIRLLADGNLTLHEKRVLQVIDWLGKAAGFSDKVCIGGNEEIASYAGISLSAVQYAVKGLVDKKYVVRSRERLSERQGGIDFRGLRITSPEERLQFFSEDVKPPSDLEEINRVFPVWEQKPIPQITVAETFRRWIDASGYCCRTPGVYIIHNWGSSRFYIGQSAKAGERLLDHLVQISQSQIQQIIPSAKKSRRRYVTPDDHPSIGCYAAMRGDAAAHGISSFAPVFHVAIQSRSKRLAYEKSLIQNVVKAGMRHRLYNLELYDRGLQDAI
jgi:hypothetical protein